ncbi:four helix bundle protein [Flavobacterium sp. Fl-77]|uniref:Four helix bundle protein n=1 Tax=Flavobacterium flavipigmentatum TaxID=2893884 RepID=A0AAJ2W096_9FLAO|nr:MULTISPECIES: four helix bundle protein [unclassified Flavobacterium]MDX6181269.1 four helix bundle protein [Flavobacterium sp. Fl-33]MDX6184870.1 four helix bundle protein [Flavobacterium sp. Fl-77]UFH39962.1 four helix bundle protein [Flavobacterium sp. F-70]
MRFQDLLAYKKSFSLAMKIFEITKSFPKEETYSLTDQIRRSSRSVPVTIAEAYRKRIYPKHFYSKLTDSDGENSETQVWLEFAFACNYISNTLYQELLGESLEIGKLINYMLLNPEKFGAKRSDQ